MALGVCDALRDAELLSDAVASGHAGERPLDEALTEYGRRRDEATLPHYRRNLLMAELGPLPPEQYALREGLRGDPAATRGFYLAFEEMVPAG
jgi:2-polyprenyl-6-methoxyphenol hydroxylase-like FAD-dependent oxidoreductase